MPKNPVLLTRSRTSAGLDFATLTLDNGPLNLFDQATFDSLAEHLAELSVDPPRALLLQAAGKLTSAGVDVHVFDGLSPKQAVNLWTVLFETIIHPLESLPCPVVFAAHGLTLTAAFEIALACDLILASTDAHFGLVETVVGLTPSMGGPQRLSERAGSGRARELVMTADLYDADTLARWGVVNAIHDDVHRAANELIRKLAGGPTKAHAATKTIVSAWRTAGVGHADKVTPVVSGALFDTADVRTGVRSFLANGPGNAVHAGR
ncbi:enoyl-CoA hydratase [Mycolicibacterium fortuitum]|uniref:enoyl-CoA hydratase/isomerase family protein n=1 Tax=Mycolicibacterium fortuitum TaxID=1766 RepID=UPI0007E95F81|nr:enoyl-CoA hydratase/isomerase family protein [Mycolicibacterium fortuitum]OBG47690.1 enoyl-CoA hydratase [Mycolicibacterium fortuitum]